MISSTVRLTFSRYHSWLSLPSTKAEHTARDPLLEDLQYGCED